MTRRPFLTVLTLPVLPPGRRVYQQVRSALRPVFKPGAPLPQVSRYPGHYAVTRSVVEGLTAAGADFNFNPTSFGELARTVYAPANEALWQAIELKRRGAVDFVAGGPVNALFADESDGILLQPELDLVIVACEWQNDFYANAPALRAKTAVWPCGVDASVWQPRAALKDTRRAVVYWKSGPREFCEQVEALLRARGLEPIRFETTHGDHVRFTPGDFRHALDGAALSVFLSTFETQGIALAEAWSMDCPTLVWDPRGPAEWRGRPFTAGSSCPYLTPATGIAWVTLDECAAAIDRVRSEPQRFSPRAWVMANMTDAICARALDRLIREKCAAVAA